MSYSFPKYYTSFPPFFTLQKKVRTKKKQQRLWLNLILSYCENKKISEIILDKAPKMELFWNKKLDRKLSLDSVQYLLDELVKEKRGEWKDKQKEICSIYYRTPVEWSQIIINFVKENGYNGSVLTFYELLEGDTGESSALHGLASSTFKKALKILSKKGLCEVMSMEGQDGVKFF